MGLKIINQSPLYYVTDGKNEMPVEFEPIDGTEVVKYTEDGKRAVVGYLCQDDMPQDPREWDNLGKMVCWHRNYKLGDEQPKCEPESFIRDLASEYTDRDVDEMDMAKVRAIVQKHYVILPLYLYDHSGITMNTSGFHCPWDSGQVGWIYVSLDRIKKEMARPKPLKKGQINPDLAPIKHVTKADRARAEKCLKAEVEEYDQYLTGDVYGVCVEAVVNVSDDPDDPDWEELCEHGVVGYTSTNPVMGDVWKEACWGYFGHGYAKEELASGVESMVERLRVAIFDDPDQLDLPLEVNNE